MQALSIANVALLAGWLLAAGCGSTAREVVGDNYKGVVAEHPCTEGGVAWVPALNDIAHFERLLPDFIVATERLAATPLHTTLPLYRRRYAGENVGGSRIMCVTFIHEDTDAVRSGRWRTAERYGIVGGGYRVWSMKFDTERSRVLDVEFQPGE
jgi:hypothetical protein